MLEYITELNLKQAKLKSKSTKNHPFDTIQTMGLGEIIFIILVAFFIAKLEIQIEGKDGWAKSLPTWKVKNKLTNLISEDYPFTGYHFWAFFTLITFIHLPFFIGTPWSLNLEIKLLSILFLITIIEDFLWFVLNPSFGIRKFNSKYAPWHKWIGPIPLTYVILIIGTCLLMWAYYFL